MVYQSKWKAEDKIRIVMESINTSISIAELCRKHGVVPNTFYDWKEKFLEAGKLGLTSGRRNGDASRELQDENERLKKLIGELTIANDSLRKRWKGAEDDSHQTPARGRGGERDEPEEGPAILRDVELLLLLQASAEGLSQTRPSSRRWRR